MSERDWERRLRRLEAAAFARRAPTALGHVPADVQARIDELLRDAPDPDSPDWTPEHHRLLCEAAALYRQCWPSSDVISPQHDLLAQPEKVIAVARILREAGVVD